MTHTKVRGAVWRSAIAGWCLVAVAGCGTDSADATDSTDDGAGASATSAAVEDEPSFGLVAPDQAALLAAEREVMVLDVRTPEEFGEGHLDGATMIDFYSDSFGAQIADLDRDATYLVYCRSGNRSGQTAALMAELGFDQVYDLDGGVLAWGGAGLPLGS